MLDWLNQYSGAANTALNLAMVAIWLFYFQLLALAYKRQRQTKVLVNRHCGHDGTGHCIVANMSPEPLLVDLVVASLDIKGQIRRGALADTFEGQRGVERRTGSLDQGATAELGAFGQIIEELAPDCSPDEVRSVEITVIGIYGPEDLPVGATRTFRKVNNEHCDFIPQERDSRQARRKNERRELENMLDRFGRFADSDEAENDKQQITTDRWGEGRS